MGWKFFRKREQQPPSEPPAPPAQPYSQDDRNKYELVLADIFKELNFDRLKFLIDQKQKTIKTTLMKNDPLRDNEVQYLRSHGFGGVLKTISLTEYKIDKSKRAQFLERVNNLDFTVSDLEVFVPDKAVDQAERIFGVVFQGKPKWHKYTDDPKSADPYLGHGERILEYDATAMETLKLQQIVQSHPDTHLEFGDADLGKFNRVLLGEPEDFCWQHPRIDLAHAASAEQRDAARTQLNARERQLLIQVGRLLTERVKENDLTGTLTPAEMDEKIANDLETMYMTLEKDRLAKGKILS